MTFAAIILILKQNWHWIRWVLIAVLILCIALFLTKCWPAKEAKLDEDKIQRIDKAIAENNKAELEKVFVEVEVEQKAIDGNMANARVSTINATHEAKKQANAMTKEELQAYLEGMK